MPQTSVPVVCLLQHIQVPQLVWQSDPEHFRGETDVPCRLTASAKIKPNQIFTPGVHIHGVGSYLSQTEVWLASLGVVSIAGFAPTTQGKDERSHKTLTAFLDARHPTSLQEVTRFLVDYRHHYNTRRRHQGLVKGRFHLTPQEAWEAFPKAESPTSPVNPDVLWNKIATYYKDTIAISAGPTGAATPTDPRSTTPASHQDTISTAPPSVSPNLPTIPVFRPPI